MKQVLAVCFAVAVLGALILAYRDMGPKPVRETDSDKAIPSEPKQSRDGNGNVVLTLKEDAQERIGLKVTRLAAGELLPEVEGYGQVVDPVPLSSLVADLMAARATADASQKELERLKVLSAHTNASPRAVQAAEAMAQRDRAVADSTRQRLLAAWGGKIADQENLPDFVQSLASGKTALVRIDALAGDVIRMPPANICLFAVTDENHPIAAQFLSPAPTINPQTQGVGLFFLVHSNQSRLLPGESVTAYLPCPGEKVTGVEVPRQAVIRFNGQAWVYLRTGDEAFKRIAIGLAHPTASGWFITADLKPADRIVVSGAQMLLSEEQKSQIQTGD